MQVKQVKLKWTFFSFLFLGLGTDLVSFSIN